jgi:catalase
MTEQRPVHGERPVLTTRQGHPVHDNQSQRTIGSRGPATLENYQFLEKIGHFDRERVVHARGPAAFGYFEAHGTTGGEPIARYTRAKLFQEAGKRTDVAVRFSTVTGGRDSSEVARDPRGFAAKFYTEDGNFPDVIHPAHRARIEGTNDYRQPGERFLLPGPWEQDNLVAALGQCDRAVQERMVWHLFMAEDEYGSRDVTGLDMTHCVHNEKAEI